MKPPTFSRRGLVRHLAVSAGAVPVLAACGAGGQSAAPVENQAIRTPQPVTLTYMHQWSQNQGHGPATDEAVKQLKAELPHLTVESAYTAQYYQKLTAVIAGGDWPDVITYNMAYLPQLISRDVVVSAHTLSKGSLRIDAGDMIPAAREMVTFEGQLRVVPYVVNSTGLVYNQTLFQKAGLDPNRPPTTWQELVEIGTRVNGRGGDNDVWGVQFPKGAADPISPMMSFLWQNKGEIVDMKRQVATWNEPQGVESLAFQVDLVHKHRIANHKLPGNAARIGQIGMWYAPPGQVSRLQMEVADAFQWATAELPRGAQRATSIGGHALAVLATNRHHDAAWQFVHWYTRPKNLAPYLAATTTLPPWKSVEQHAAWQQFVRDSPHIKPFVQGLSYARPTPKLAAWEEIVGILAAARDSAAEQKQSPKQALDDAARLAEPLIKQG